MKKIKLFITVLMILVILLSGCGGGKTVDNNTSGEGAQDYIENENSQNTDTIIEDSQEGPEFTLNVQVLSEKEAVLKIEGIFVAGGNIGTLSQEDDRGRSAVSYFLDRF